MTISYHIDDRITPQQAAQIYANAGLNRPTDLRVLQNMLEHANVLITAWDGDTLIGLLRAMTDYSFDCYVNDLAVDQAYQKQGIGRALVQRLLDSLDEKTLVFLISAPEAITFYRRLGFQNFKSQVDTWYLTVKG